MNGDEREQRAAFFAAVLGRELPRGLYGHLWHPSPDKHTDWVRGTDAAEASASRNGRHDVYFGAGLAPKGGEHERIRNTTAAGLLGLPADIDIAGAAHAQTDLPRDQQAALDLLGEIAVAASIVIDSGHGIQAWWLFDTPWVFKDEDDKERAFRLCANWQAYINAKAAVHGWKLDNVGDLARVMRVPGTFNAKKKTEIVPVRLLRVAPDVRYTPDELEAICADARKHAGAHGDSEAVDEEQRFTEEQPCPICTGYESLEQGTAERCWGYYSRDRRRAFCTRGEYKGKLKPHVNAIGAEMYIHNLWGKCPCGDTHQLIDGPQEGRALWNATFYAGMYADRLRYVSWFNRWHESNGKWWEPNQDKVALRLGYVAVASLYRQAADETDRRRKTELGALAVKLDTAKTINEMVAGASALFPIAAKPDAFDRNDWQMVFANGVVDLRTGALLAHDPSALHSRHAGRTLDSIVYDPDAPCPNWLRFLSTIFPETDGAEMIGYVQRMAGYTSTGNTREQCIFILEGDGDNGKTTFTQAVGDVLGTYYEEMHTETLLSTAHEQHPTAIAKLVGVRGAFASENDQNRTLAEAFIKHVTGGEDIDAHLMRQDFFTFKPKFKIWLHTNHKPKVRGKDKGIWRRLRVVPFQHTFTDDDKIKDYYERYLAPELPGIAAWVVRGALEWQRIGLAEPARVTQAWATYHTQSDTLKTFVDEAIYHAEPNAFLPSSVAFAEYAKWCRLQNETIESQTALSLAIKAAYNVESIKVKGRGRGFYALGVQTGKDDAW